MEYSRFLDCLAADFVRLRAVVPTDLTAPVPSWPGWTVADLTRHVGNVYVHKTLAMREGAEPDPWPPKELAHEGPLALLDRAYAGLLDKFAARKPEDPAGSWYTPDQTVGFWIRRMAQETVIHRIDAELGSAVRQKDGERRRGCSSHRLIAGCAAGCPSGCRLLERSVRIAGHAAVQVQSV